MSQIQEKYRILFKPFKLGNLEVKNRFCMAGMGGNNDKVYEDGACDKDMVDYYVERAKGGFGLISTGTMTIIEREKYKSAEVLLTEKVDPETFIRTFGHMNDRIHAYGAKSMIQLSLGTAPAQFKKIFSPSIICNDFTKEDFKYFVERFRVTSKMAKDAGFDIVEVHCVHTGYLLDQLATASVNQRTDEYGGSLENRARLMGEIRQAISESCGPDYPVSIKLGATTEIFKCNFDAEKPEDRMQIFTRDVNESAALAKVFEQQGYDMITLDQIGDWQPFTDIRECRDTVQTIKDAVKIPLIAGGRLNDPDVGSDFVREGVCDMLYLGRQTLADPAYVNKLRCNRMEDIRFCLACNQGCVGRNLQELTVKCAINPSAGRETGFDFAPLRRKKKVIVVGGGVGGMEAARVAASRGHEVKLYERSSRLGGDYYAATDFPFRKFGRHYIGVQERQLKALPVELVFDKEVTAEELIAQNPDVIILAVGADEFVPPLKGIDSEKVILATDYILNHKKDKENVVVIGGGMTGAEIAMEDALAGKNVYLVEMQRDILLDPSMDGMTRQSLYAAVNRAGVKVMAGTKLLEVTDTGVMVEKDGEAIALVADVVVLAVGFRPRKKLYAELVDYAGEVYNLGNSNKVGNISDAVWAAYEVANGI